MLTPNATFDMEIILIHMLYNVRPAIKSFLTPCEPPIT